MSRLDPRWDDADEQDRRYWLWAAGLLVVVGVFYATTLLTSPLSLALLLWVVYLAAALVLIIIRYHRLSVLVPIVAGGVWVVALVLTWSYG